MVVDWVITGRILLILNQNLKVVRILVVVQEPVVMVVQVCVLYGIQYKITRDSIVQITKCHIKPPTGDCGGL